MRLKIKSSLTVFALLPALALTACSKSESDDAATTEEDTATPGTLNLNIPSAVATSMKTSGALHLTASACTDYKDKLIACNTDADSYTHGAFKLFQSKICEANFEVAAYIEHTFCVLKKDLALTLTVADEPTEFTATYDGKSFVITTEKPSDSWAEDAGYTGKVTVKVDGSTKSVIYWAGDTEDKTKGFMIDGPISLDGEAVSRGIYIQWDRTTDEQTLKYFGGFWDPARTYLEYATSGNDMLTRGRYGYLAYNSTSKTVKDLQVITQQNKLGSTTVVPACYRQRMWGVLGDQVWTFNTNGSSPEDVAATDLDGISNTSDGTSDVSQLGNGEKFPDLKTWPNGQNQGTLSSTDTASPPFDTAITTATSSTTVAGPGDFHKSCASVKDTLLFKKTGTSVNFDATPADVF